MTIAEILTAFELQVGDTTELSSAEELMVLNRVRRRINRKPMEANRKAFSGTQSTSLPYVALPSDFFRVAQNNNYSGPQYYSENPVVFVGTLRTPVTLIPFADRGQYVNASDKAYLDLPNERLYFTLQPTATNSLNFDYYALPADLLINGSDWITNKFPEALIYGMATEDFILQLSDKARSYAPENQAKYLEEMAEIASWNFSFIQR